MALSLTATAGSSSANSYVTIAEADAYFLAHPDFTTWDALDTPTKQRHLIRATREIDLEAINGTKYDTSISTAGAPTQPLKFPRGQDVSSNGTKYIPVSVKNACYEQALANVRSGGSTTRADLQAQGVTSITIGDVSESYGDGAAAGGLSQRSREFLMAEGILDIMGQWSR